MEWEIHGGVYDPASLHCNVSDLQFKFFPFTGMYERLCLRMGAMSL